MALQLSGHWMLAEQQSFLAKSSACFFQERSKPIEALSMINLTKSMHLWVVKRYIPHLHIGIAWGFTLPIL